MAITVATAGILACLALGSPRLRAKSLWPPQRPGAACMEPQYLVDTRYCVSSSPPLKLLVAVFLQPLLCAETCEGLGRLYRVPRDCALFAGVVPDYLLLVLHVTPPLARPMPLPREIVPRLLIALSSRGWCPRRVRMGHSTLPPPAVPPAHGWLRSQKPPGKQAFFPHPPHAHGARLYFLGQAWSAHTRGSVLFSLYLPVTRRAAWNARWPGVS